MPGGLNSGANLVHLQFSRAGRGLPLTVTDQGVPGIARRRLARHLVQPTGQRAALDQCVSGVSARLRGKFRVQACPIPRQKALA